MAIDFGALAGGQVGNTVGGGSGIGGLLGGLLGGSVGGSPQQAPLQLGQQQQAPQATPVQTSAQAPAQPTAAQAPESPAAPTQTQPQPDGGGGMEASQYANMFATAMLAAFKPDMLPLLPYLQQMMQGQQQQPIQSPGGKETPQGAVVGTQAPQQAPKPSGQADPNANPPQATEVPMGQGGDMQGQGVESGPMDMMKIAMMLMQAGQPPQATPIDPNQLGQGPIL